MRKNIKNSYIVFKPFFLAFLLGFLSQQAIASTKDSLAILSQDKTELIDVEKFEKINLSIDKAIKTGDNLLLFKFYCDKANQIQASKTYTVAQEVLLQALEVADNHLGKEEQEIVRLELAKNYQYLGNYSEAQNQFYQLIQTSSSNQAYPEKALSGIGDLYIQIGDYDQALNNYKKALEINIDKNNLIESITNHCRLSCIYQSKNEPEKAMQHINEAFHISKQVADSQQIGVVLMKFGDLLEKQNKSTRAIANYLQASKCFTLPDKANEKSLLMIKIANLYYDQQKFNIANNYLKKASVSIHQLSKKNQAKLFLIAGKLQIVNSQKTNAEASLKKSLQIAKTLELTNIQQEASHQLFDLFNQSKEFDQALFHLEQASQLNDSIYSNIKAKQITQLQFKYHLEKNEKEINSLKLRQNTIMLIGFLIFALVVFTSLSYLWRMSVRNNTELLKKNEEIQVHNTKLHESNKILQQFTYVAANDLKEPLSNIGSYITLLENKYGLQFNEEAKEYMSFVTNGAQRMDLLLQDLLKYSKISSEKARREPQDLKIIMDQVSEKLKEEIEKKQATIDIGSNNVNIPMSQIHLTQLLQNLVSNSIKFNQQKPYIKIRSYKTPNIVTILVEDNGIGIPEEFGNKIFNLFQVLDKKGNYEGRGIGLTICKNIVDKYNADIWFEANKKGKGTTFVVRIPVYEDADNESNLKEIGSSYSNTLEK